MALHIYHEDREKKYFDLFYRHDLLKRLMGITDKGLNNI